MGFGSLERLKGVEGDHGDCGGRAEGKEEKKVEVVQEEKEQYLPVSSNSVPSSNPMV